MTQDAGTQDAGTQDAGTKTGADRRGAERLTTDEPARVTLRNGIVLIGAFVDVSRTGGRFRADDVPDLARWTTVQVNYGDLEMKARVIWQNRFRDGSSELGLEAVDDS